MYAILVLKIEVAFNKLYRRDKTKFWPRFNHVYY